MRTAVDWKDYGVIATGGGEKLERWGGVVLLRPDPQIIWPARTPLRDYRNISAVYTREGGGGGWESEPSVPAEWQVSYKDMKLLVRLMGFKHTGVFPEQAVNWDIMSGLVKGAGRGINALNLFAYTGAASVSLAAAGATVTHVDAAKNMVERAGENARLNGIDNIRYIIDDCAKFVAREIKRGRRYDAILMDPPSYGRGPSGELWKLEDNLFSFVSECVKLLSDDPLFFLVNSYTTGLQPTVLKNILQLNVGGRGEFDAYGLGLPTDEGIVLPCGASGIFVSGNKRANKEKKQ
ncbi:MAG: class I SAM-dependent methyltransferase [Clostridiales bacterium]|jgi:23S rRNA (cytosine1962-C5)-methyltransferase|nr:class I SAM-dependent methyltransferase [Clostridiales bacterium]